MLCGYLWSVWYHIYPPHTAAHNDASMVVSSSLSYHHIFFQIESTQETLLLLKNKHATTTAQHLLLTHSLSSPRKSFLNNLDKKKSTVVVKHLKNNMFVNRMMSRCHVTRRFLSSSSSSYEHILTERRGKVGWITLNRPKALNGNVFFNVDSLSLYVKK